MDKQEKAQLNLDIAQLLWPDAEFEVTKDSVVLITWFVDDDTLSTVEFDFRNWNDLMPEIIEHEIGFHKSEPSIPTSDGFWFAKPRYGIVGYSGSDLQETLAQCLLAVLQAKQENEE